MYKDFFKGKLDFVFSFIGLLILSPFFIIVLIILMFLNNGKPFFYQPRPGKNERIFNIIKFKTMTDAKDSEGNLLPDIERVTRFGSFVRKTSLDEIPQLINVLIGDMSIVGPRPLRTYYLPLYTNEQRKRHNVRPGITGWAQVNGRNTITWTKKFEYDVWYVDNLSLFLDVKILFLTIRKVFQAKDINVSEKVTMERFNGLN